MKRWQQRFVGDSAAGDGWTTESAEDWGKTNQLLADRVAAGDDAALIELVRRDPRVLASELCAAKVLSWRFAALVARLGGRRDDESTALLARFASAVRFQPRWPVPSSDRVFDLFAQALSVVDDLLAHVPPAGRRLRPPDVADLARAFSLPESAVELLVRDRRNRFRVARQEAAWSYPGLVDT